MEILPNLYFADFYRRNGSSSKYTEAISGQVVGSRQTLEVATSNSVIQQFRSHSRELRSRLEVIVSLTKAVATGENLLRQSKKSQHHVATPFRGRDTVRRHCWW